MNDSNSTSDESDVVILPQPNVLQNLKRKKKSSFIGRTFKKSYKKSKPASSPSLSPSTDGSSPSTDGSSSEITTPSDITTPTSSPTSTIDNISNPSYFGPKAKRLNFIRQEKVRVAIEVYFKVNFYASYSPDQLSHYVKTICTLYKLNSYGSVKNIILDVKKSLDLDE